MTTPSPPSLSAPAPPTPPLVIDPDICRASSPPGRFYRDPALFELLRERVLARAWHLVGDADELGEPGQLSPVRVLPGCLDEPLLLARDHQGELRALSNVCTHRGNLVCMAAGKASVLRCGYHGRRFGLDGRFLSMPEFEGAVDFPSEKDDLVRLPQGRWGRFVFAALGPVAGSAGGPAFSFEELLGPVRARLPWLDWEGLVRDAARSRTYELEAHWALYCENYLEGFHIPYVHPALGREVDYASYTTELLGLSSLQVGLAARDDQPAFEAPAGSPDHGRRVAGYYLFLFPNLMFNVYPGGLSINVVEPLGPERTRVRYLTYVRPRGDSVVGSFAQGASADLDRVELEDEQVVAQVHVGVRSRLYRGGRYSPSREVAVHHFHRLLAAQLARP